jgi:hypothetical protein
VCGRADGGAMHRELVDPDLAKSMVAPPGSGGKRRSGLLAHLASAAKSVHIAGFYDCRLKVSSTSTLGPSAKVIHAEVAHLASLSPRPR